MPLESNFEDLSNSGFGNGSSQGSLTGIRFDTNVSDIRAGDPIFPEHVLRLYQLLAADVSGAEVGVTGLIAASDVKVNEKLTAFDVEVQGTLNLSGSLSVPGNISAGGDISAGGNLSAGGSLSVSSTATISGNTTVGGNLEVSGEFDFSSGSGSFGTNVAQAFESIVDDGSSDLDTSVSSNQLVFSISSSSVTSDDISASGTGFLEYDGNSLNWTGINTDSDFDGDGTSGNQLGIASNAVSNAELEDMPANTIKAQNSGSTGDPNDFSIGSNTFVGRSGSNALEDVSVDAGEIVGRTDGGGPLKGLSQSEAKNALDINASDVGAGTFDDGSNNFSFDDRLELQGGARVINSELQFENSGGDVTSIENVEDGFSDELVIGDSTLDDIILETSEVIIKDSLEPELKFNDTNISSNDYRVFLKRNSSSPNELTVSSNESLFIESGSTNQIRLRSVGLSLKLILEDLEDGAGGGETTGEVRYDPGNGPGNGYLFLK